jgi:hypothetical protein
MKNGLIHAPSFSLGYLNSAEEHYILVSMNNDQAGLILDLKSMLLSFFIVELILTFKKET